LKEKIILVAGLGGGAFGIGSSAGPGSGRPILFMLIPLMFAYIDVVCTHNDIRIRIIASFLRSRRIDADFKAYEGYCARNRGAFLVERVALVAATLLFSLMVGAIALCPTVATMFFTCDLSLPRETFSSPLPC
jgi:hypothetical protein